MTLEERITQLEARLAQQQQRRDQAQAVLQEATVAVYQLQGALSVLRDLQGNSEDREVATE